MSRSLNKLFMSNSYMIHGSPTVGLPVPLVSVDKNPFQLVCLVKKNVMSHFSQYQYGSPGN